MELGEIYKADGLISYEKLFYFHYRIIPNQLVFTDLDGARLAQAIAEQHKNSIKEEKDSLCFDLVKRMDVLDEKTIIFNTEEIITGNGYSLQYYYGNKRILDDDYLRKLAADYFYNTKYHNDLQ